MKLDIIEYINKSYAGPISIPDTLIDVIIYEYITKLNEVDRNAGIFLFKYFNKYYNEDALYFTVYRSNEYEVNIDKIDINENNAFSEYVFTCKDGVKTYKSIIDINIPHKKCMHVENVDNKLHIKPYVEE